MAVTGLGQARECCKVPQNRALKQAEAPSSSPAKSIQAAKLPEGNPMASLGPANYVPFTGQVNTTAAPPASTPPQAPLVAPQVSPEALNEAVKTLQSMSPAEVQAVTDEATKVVQSMMQQAGPPKA